MEGNEYAKHDNSLHIFNSNNRMVTINLTAMALILIHVQTVYIPHTIHTDCCLEGETRPRLTCSHGAWAWILVLNRFTALVKH